MRVGVNVYMCMHVLLKYTKLTVYFVHVCARATLFAMRHLCVRWFVFSREIREKFGRTLATIGT